MLYKHAYYMYITYSVADNDKDAHLWNYEVFAPTSAKKGNIYI